MPRPDISIADHHAVQRSLQKLAVGAPQRAVDRETAFGRERLGEWEQQFQVPIGSDRVGPGISRTHTRLKFPYPFRNATGQRDNLLTYPVFTYGVELISGDMPNLTAAVTRWGIRKSDQSVYSARIQISVSNPFSLVPDPAGGPAPAEAATIAFQGWLHCVFQGWSAIANERKA